MPDFAIAQRAVATAFVTFTVANPSTTYTTTLALGNDPTPAPVPSPKSSPSNGAVVGAVIGSIIGFLLLLILIIHCIRRSNSDWAPYLGSDRSSFSSIYVRNPNAVPTVAWSSDITATTQVIRESETRTFFFTRPSRRSQQFTSSRHYSSEGSDSTSASSESS